MWRFCLKERAVGVKAFRAATFAPPRITTSQSVRRIGHSITLPRRYLLSSTALWDTEPREQAAIKANPKRTKSTNAREFPSEAAWQKDLNSAQVEAVTKPLYSITRVVAGPGSGKTRVLTSRIAYLLEEDPEARVLAVTFTRKASLEMQQRLEALLKKSNTYTPPPRQSSNNGIVEEEEFSEGKAHVRALSRVTLGTFHKTCADILRYNGKLLASLPSIQHEMMGSNATVLDGSFAIMDQSDQLRIMRECLKENHIDLKDAGGVKPLDVLRALLEIKTSINHGADPFEASSRKTSKPIPKNKEIALKIYRFYRESMLSNNLLDFDDLIYLTREMLTEHQEVRQQLHRRWTHVLVDEYQDTSRAQIDLVRLWTASSLLVVGDGDQSIYSWRGADPNSLSTFDDEFKSYLGEIQTVHLTDNYRSTSNIVSAAQKVIASGETSLAEQLRQDMTPKRGSGSTPRIVACSDGKAEANLVVKTIQKKLASEEYTSATTVSVLYRTNAQSLMLEEACVNNNLPYVILGKATSFYKRREVKDCLCFLRWLYNGRDKGSMLRAFQTPSRGIGDRAIEQFEYYCVLVREACEEANKPSPTQLDILLSFTDPEVDGMPLRKDAIATRPLKLFTEFSKQMQEIQELALQAPVEKVLETVINMFDLMAHFDKVSDSKTVFQERQGNVQELQRATGRYRKDGPALQSQTSLENKSPLGAFLDDVALVTELSDGNESEGEENSGKKRFVLSLMTIHASKGMEFDSVFVVGNEDSTFPTSRAIQAGKGSVELAEECRLCYVAITRAKTDLCLTWRREVARFNPNSENGFRYVNASRSRFLDALVKTTKKESKAANPPPGVAGKKAVTLSDAPRSMRRPTPSYRASQNNGNSGQDGIHSHSNSISTRRSASGRSASQPRSGSPSNPYRAAASSQTRRAADSPFPSRTRTPRSDPLPPSMTPTSRQAPKVQPKRRKPQRSAAPMDSTWFFPVGSAVIHKKHGRGLVLNPPPSDKPGDLRVLVEFKNGRKLDFPVQGDELKPGF